MTPPVVHPFLLELMKSADAAALAPPRPDDAAWDAITGEAIAQNLIPLLHKWLTDSGWAAKLPPARLERIKADVFRLAARNLALAQEAAAVLRACEARRVPCAPVRGPALAELLYGTVAARPMGDLDFLVRKDDLPAVADILRGLGFCERNRQPGFAQAYSNTLEFVSERHGGMVVEPHWTIAYPPFADRIDMEAVWHRCARGRAVGVDTWLLDRTDLLLHLCLHIIHRAESAPLLWFYELDRFLRQSREAIDWPRLVLMSRAAGLEHFVSDVLRTLAALFDSPVHGPSVMQLHQSASAPRSRSLGARLERRLIRLLAGNARADGRESLALLFTIAGFGAKVRYTAALLFPSPEFMRLHYGLSGQPRLAFGYLARLRRIAAETIRGLGELLAANRAGPSS